MVNRNAGLTGLLLLASQVADAMPAYAVENNVASVTTTAAVGQVELAKRQLLGGLLGGGAKTTTTTTQVVNNIIQTPTANAGSGGLLGGVLGGTNDGGLLGGVLNNDGGGLLGGLGGGDGLLGAGVLSGDNLVDVSLAGEPLITIPNVLSDVIPLPTSDGAVLNVGVLSGDPVAGVTLGGGLPVSATVNIGGAVSSAVGGSDLGSGGLPVVGDLQSEGGVLSGLTGAVPTNIVPTDGGLPVPTDAATGGQGGDLLGGLLNNGDDGLLGGVLGGGDGGLLGGVTGDNGLLGGGDGAGGLLPSLGGDNGLLGVGVLSGGNLADITLAGQPLISVPNVLSGVIAAPTSDGVLNIGVLSGDQAVGVTIGGSLPISATVNILPNGGGSGGDGAVPTQGDNAMTTGGGGGGHATTTTMMGGGHATTTTTMGGGHATTMAAPTASTCTANGMTYQNGQETTVGGLTYKVMCATDNSQGSYKAVGVNSGGFSTCFSACNADSECKGFTYVGASNGNCYLKSAMGTPSPAGSNVVSAFIVGGTRPSHDATATSTADAATPTTCTANGVTYQNGEETTVDGLTYKVMCATDNSAGAYKAVGVNSGGFSKCFSACNAEAECKGFTFSGGSSGNCYLKSAMGTPSPAGPSIVSCFIVAGTRTSTPATSTTTTNTGVHPNPMPTSRCTQLGGNVNGTPYRYTDPHGAVYDLYCQYEVSGSVLSVNGGTFDQCFNLCDASSECAGFAWVPNTCYLKNAFNNIGYISPSNADMAIVVHPAPGQITTTTTTGPVTTTTASMTTTAAGGSGAGGDGGNIIDAGVGVTGGTLVGITVSNNPLISATLNVENVVSDVLGNVVGGLFGAQATSSGNIVNLGVGTGTLVQATVSNNPVASATINIPKRARV